MTIRRAISPVSTIDPVGLVVDGLETLARDMREGKFPVPVRRVVVVVSGPSESPGEDGVGLCFFGAEASLITVVGMLELAKAQAIAEEQ